MAQTNSLSSSAVRTLLKSIFKTNSDYDAFVVDFFPKIAKAMASELDREARINYLFQCVGHEHVYSALRKGHGFELMQHIGTEERDKRSLPDYENELAYDIGERLMTLYQERASLLKTRDEFAVANINESIISLQREMRKELTIRAGDFLSDGKYQLIRKIGQGGFAAVWLANEWAKSRTVAIKILLPQWNHEQSYKDRFYQGAYKMWQLQHNNIVRVFDTAIEDHCTGLHYFTMQYIKGTDLQTAILSRQLSYGRIIQIIYEIGQAISYAHSRGVIHRDVKPANILLDEMNQTYLTDFDLVWHADVAGATRTNIGIGTLFYAAPELMMNAKQPCYQSDIYSLAMSLAFCLHGHDLPIDAIRNTIEFVHKLKCAHALKVALIRAMKWKPEERYASMDEFLGVLGCHRNLQGADLLGSQSNGEDRARMVYELSSSSGLQRKELPLHILLLLDLYRGTEQIADPLGERERIICSPRCIDRLLRVLQPTIQISVPNVLTGDRAQDLKAVIRISSFEDFSPRALIRNMPALNSWSKLKNAVSFIGTRFTDTGDVNYHSWFSTVVLRRVRYGLLHDQDSFSALVQEITARGQFPLHTKNIVIESLIEISIQIEVIDRIISSGCETNLDLLAAMDRMLNQQIDLILHAPSFLLLEEQWRSFNLLASSATPEDGIRLTVLHCTKPDIIEDLGENETFRASDLYYHINLSEFGSFGGRPYSLVVADFEFHNTTEDINAMRWMSEICESANAIFVCSGSLSWFDIRDFRGLREIHINDYLSSMMFKEWRCLRELESSRYLVVACGRFPLRPLYQRMDSEVCFGDASAMYEEKITSPEQIVCGLGAIAIVSWIITEYQKTGWFPSLAGDTNRVNQQDLNAETVANFLLPHDKIPELVRNGFFPVAYDSVRNSYQITNDSNAYFDPFVDMHNDLISANRDEPGIFYRKSAFRHFLYMIIYCRVQHYLNAISRECYRPFSDTEAELRSLEETLNQWVKLYVSDMIDPDPGILRQRPIRFASVAVSVDSEEERVRRPRVRIGLTLIPHPLVAGVEVPKRPR